MPSAFDAQLLNGPFGDPALFVDVPEARRAFLIDVGDLGALAPRKALRVTDVLVSHAHMDHWCGFDRLLRLSLGRDRRIGIFGPPGIADRVGHKLRAYTWNLLDGYGNDLVLDVTEVGEGGPSTRSAFRLRGGFARESPADAEAGRAREPAGSPVVLAEDDNLRVSAVTLDHGTPCLAFAIQERARANVWKDRLAELGLGVGPWLRELKGLALAGAPADTPLVARWRGDGGTPEERACTLGEVAGRALTVSRGRKLAYVTDTAWTASNLARAVGLARDADVLHVEAPFPDRDRERAAARRHLTALQAGTLARLARVGRVVPFHLSPRHAHEEATLRAEVAAGFCGEASATLPSGLEPPTSRHG